MKTSDFFTRSACNDGAKVNLKDPATGKDSGEWVLIRGIDSDAFRAKEAELKKRLLTLENPEDHQDEMEAELIASLIIDWSLEDECSEENKLLLCTEAPLVVNEINIQAANRALFLKKK